MILEEEANESNKERKEDWDETSVNELKRKFQRFS